MKRKKIKTILCHMAIITISVGVFCHGYISGNSISLADRVNVYAEDDVVSRNDVIESFKAYCRDRNLIINGSVLGSAFEWTGSAIDSALSAIGVDMDYLQAQISKETSGNLGVRWLVNATGMNIYNRLFAELLQRESLSVGDENVDKVVYSGDRFTDDNGNSCLIYVLDNDATNNSFAYYSKSKIQKYGSALVYTSDWANSNLSVGEYINVSFTVNGNTYTGRKSSANNSSRNGLGFGKFTGNFNGDTNVTLISAYDRYYAMGASNVSSIYGHCCVFKIGDKLYIGSCRFNSGYAGFASDACNFIGVEITDADTEPVNVDVKTPPDKKILPDPPENPTTIYPGDDPGGDNPGGGGGDDPGGEPDNWNPTTPTIPTPTNPNFPTVELPDIDIPDLPSLNFSLGDLRNKFPFSLPFDIIAVLNVLDGEPQAPHIQATVPIGRWYTWEMDFDFSEFDNYARIFRAFEFIGFCIGLAVFTVHFVKG